MTRRRLFTSTWKCLSLAGFAFGLAACQTPTTTGQKPYFSKAYKPTDPGNVQVKVSLSQQAVYVMEGDRPLMITACCVGKADKPTPKGNFTIYSKNPTRRRIASPGSGHPLPFWCEFRPGYGFHAGTVYPVPASWGCIRLHHNVAPKFFALVQSGTKVNIAHSQPEDLTLGKELVRPTDYAGPGFPHEVMYSNRIFEVYDGPVFDG